MQAPVSYSKDSNDNQAAKSVILSVPNSKIDEKGNASAVIDKNSSLEEVKTQFEEKINDKDFEVTINLGKDAVLDAGTLTSFVTAKLPTDKYDVAADVTITADTNDLNNIIITAPANEKSKKTGVSTIATAGGTKGYTGIVSATLKLTNDERSELTRAAGETEGHYSARVNAILDEKDLSFSFKSNQVVSDYNIDATMQGAMNSLFGQDNMSDLENVLTNRDAYGIVSASQQCKFVDGYLTFMVGLTTDRDAEADAETVILSGVKFTNITESSIINGEMTADALTEKINSELRAKNFDKINFEQLSFRYAINGELNGCNAENIFVRTIRSEDENGNSSVRFMYLLNDGEGGQIKQGSTHALGRGVTIEKALRNDLEYLGLNQSEISR